MATNKSSPHLQIRLNLSGLLLTVSCSPSLLLPSPPHSPISLVVFLPFPFPFPLHSPICPLILPPLSHYPSPVSPLLFSTLALFPLPSLHPLPHTLIFWHLVSAVEKIYKSYFIFRKAQYFLHSNDQWTVQFLGLLWQKFLLCDVMIINLNEMYIYVHDTLTMYLFIAKLLWFIPVASRK